MVGIGFALLALSAWFAWSWWRRREVPENRWLLRAVAVSGVLALVALWSGWIVTEVGRQPWTVVGLLLTRDAVTRAGNVWLLLRRDPPALPRGGHRHPARAAADAPALGAGGRRR